MRDKHRPSVDGPGRDEFQAYIQGDLPEEEKKALEAFLSENPIASDALEGLKWVEKPKKVVAHVKRIQQRTQERIHVHKEENSFDTKRSFRVRPDLQWRPLVASLAGLAAMVLVVFMIIFYSKSNPEIDTGIASSEPQSITETAPLAKTEESRAEEKSQKRIPSVSIPSSPTPLIAENTSPQRQNRSKRTAKEERINPGSSQVTNRIGATASTGVSSPSVKQFNYLDISVEESLPSDISVSNSGILQSSAPLSSQAVLSISPSIEADELQMLEETLVIYPSEGISTNRRKAKKRTALSMREAPGKAEIEDIQQQFFQSPLPILSRENRAPENPKRTLTANIGIWYFTYDMYSEAEMELQQLLLAHPNEAHTIDWAHSSAQWYLSKIYLATGRETEAKNLLREISAYPNLYRAHAQQVLRKL